MNRRPGSGQPYLEPIAGNVEGGVLSVADALNAISGVVTRAGCEGHWPLWQPFVSFCASNRFAEYIDRYRSEQAMRESSSHLVCVWHLWAMFVTDRYLWFCLSGVAKKSSRVSVPGLSLIMSPVSRRRIVADICELVSVVSNYSRVLDTTCST